MGDVRIGISGWTYPPWRGVFYPPDLPHRSELEFAASRMNSVEINGSFYSLQRPSSYRSWFEQTPDDFVFAVKGGRFITHMKKLAGVDTPLANFFGSGVLALENKLGPLLWQLPPMLGFDPDRLAAFFERLPRTTGEAARLAERHDGRLRHGAVTTTAVDRPLRHALEIRHGSYVTPGFVELLRAHDVALVVADTAGKWPFLEDLTSNFVYARLHGSQELYVSGYDDQALDWWAARVRAWVSGGSSSDARTVGPPVDPRPDGRDVFVYFDNDVKVRGPFDAMGLAARVGATPG
ncbi:MAG TPA: DUF72 domain-containing protein [Jiangellaceae bacterium]|nr:DUF72 domain-containing protein [Jiangellaceae bacterium]